MSVCFGDGVYASTMFECACVNVYNSLNIVGITNTSQTKSLISY